MQKCVKLALLSHSRTEPRGFSLSHLFARDVALCQTTRFGQWDPGVPCSCPANAVHCGRYIPRRTVGRTEEPWTWLQNIGTVWYNNNPQWSWFAHVFGFAMHAAKCSNYDAFIVDKAFVWIISWPISTCRRVKYELDTYTGCFRCKRRYFVWWLYRQL